MTMSGTPKKNLTLQMTASEQDLAAIDKSADRTGAYSRADALRRAIRVYDAVTRVAQEDGEVVLLRRDGSKERIVT
jgi:hypothetical protein